MPIPVQNIYFLLCYAWDEFAPKQVERVASESFPDALHLFASMLDAGVRAIHRRGLDTGYISLEESTSSPRGRILISQSVRVIATQPSRVYCSCDEMSADVLTNQILKATLRLVQNTEGLDADVRGRIRKVSVLFDRVTDIALSLRVFNKVQLNRNNRLYAFLINVCRFLYESLLPADHAGIYRFQDVFREPERLRRIFEKFVRNYYRRNTTALTVRKERMAWVGSALGDAEFSLVPQMETDVTLRWPDRVLVIECKYTESLFQRNYLTGKFRSTHLYQLAAYLRNLGDRAEGILLYPTVDVRVDQQYELQEHRVRVGTVDLNRPWVDIADCLLRYVEPQQVCLSTGST